MCICSSFAYLHPYSFTHYSLPSLCNWMQWDFFSSERHWRKFDMHSFKVRHSFHSVSLGLRVWYPWAGLSDYFCFCSCNLFVFSRSPPGLSANFFQSHLVCQYLVWQAVFNQANWDGVRRLQAAFFPSYVIYFTSLTWPSDLFLCPWDGDTEQSECLIALFYLLYEYFMYFGPACGFWSETQRKTVWKREHLLFSQSVCEREGEHLLDSAIPQCLFQVTFAVFLLMFYKMFSHIYGLRVTLWQPNMFVSPALEHKVNL